MAGTKIVNCNCVSEYQDRTQGKNKRVANHAPKANGYRCTVCGKLHQSSEKK